MSPGGKMVVVSEEPANAGNDAKTATSAGVITTATEQIKRRSDLLMEIDRLRKLSQLRTRFINTAAHEFATPLTPLRIQVSLLRGGVYGPLTDRQTEAVQVMERNMERLSKLVQDVLDVARLEAERLIITRTPIDLARLAHGVVATFKPQAEARKITLHLEAPGNVAMDGDADRLTQVFVNLVHNALKFTPDGGEIRVRISQHDEGARVEVRDTGRGVKPEDMVRLFVPFSQLTDEDHAKLGGTGLGLSICQGIIAQHGGRIWCESSGPGKGTRFVFVLPLKAEPTEIIAATVRSRTGWKLFTFSCPECTSRDVQLRLLGNRYDCMTCHYRWR